MGGARAGLGGRRGAGLGDVSTNGITGAGLGGGSIGDGVGGGVTGKGGGTTGTIGAGDEAAKHAQAYCVCPTYVLVL